MEIATKSSLIILSRALRSFVIFVPSILTLIQEDNPKTRTIPFSSVPQEVFSSIIDEVIEAKLNIDNPALALTTIDDFVSVLNEGVTIHDLWGVGVNQTTCIWQWCLISG